MPNVSDMIVQEAQRQGVDPSLALEVGRAESNLDPNVPDSTAGAIGVFQLEPATAAQLGVNPRDLTQNIRGGIRYLGQMLAQFGGSVPAALAAYNWGPGNLAKAIAQYATDWINHLPSETAHYISKIVSNLSQYKAAITPASVANGVKQVLLPSSPDDSQTVDAGAPPPPSSSPLVPILILGALGLGAYIVSEVFSDD